MYVEGVNLGNWLVLEKWMSPGLFAGTTAEDEYYLPAQLSPEVYEARIRMHRSEYITERDFATIKSFGLNAVRIPIPYFIFGDRPPFIGCIEELDKAFAWAEKYGMKILGYYFAQYVLGNENAYTPTANALSVSQIIMLFCTPFIMKKFGKRNTAFFGMTVAAAAYLLTALAGNNVSFVVATNILKGLGFGCCGATMFGMLQDAITYGSWLTGVQAMGMGNAASSFCMKVGSGIGTAALGWILSAGGFNTDPASAGALAALKVSYIWIPLAGCIVCGICLLLFDLDKYYGQAVADLSEGKRKGSR